MFFCECEFGDLKYVFENKIFFDNVHLVLIVMSFDMMCFALAFWTNFLFVPF